MKSTIVLFVLCAGVCLSATAQVEHSALMKMTQPPKISKLQESTFKQGIIKRAKKLPTSQGISQQKGGVATYYLPVRSAYTATYKLPTKKEKLPATSKTPVKTPKKQ